ncbi:MAG TPA: Fe-Mn family superoxide dismutase [Burkholderiales bacterium]|nr:Fe-Mn family superoxide dismutase [Burkholderiales bacterium]
MRYQLTPMFYRPYLLNDLSQKLIESHYEHNYGGALRRLNAIKEQLESLDFAAAPACVIGDLKREELAALNSTLLHELYFASLGPAGRPTAALVDVLARDFGSAERWRCEFIAMGRALAGGSGWVLLVYLPRDGRLANQYASEHSQAVAAGGIPILALDMYEHAYHIDFGANAEAYVHAFMRNIDWKALQLRYEDALKTAPPRPLVQPEFGDLPGVSVEEVKTMLAAGKPVQLMDVRPQHYVSRTRDGIQGAVWRDPECVQEWAGELLKSHPVVVFCMYGFDMGCKAAMALRDAGFDAKYMKGGYASWKAIAGPTKPYA